MLTGAPQKGSLVGYKGSDCAFLNEFLTNWKNYEVVESYPHEEYFHIIDDSGQTLPIFKDEGDYEHFYVVLSTTSIQTNEPEEASLMEINIQSSPTYVKAGQVRTNVDRETYWLVVADDIKTFNAVTLQDDLIGNFTVDYPSGATAEQIAADMPIVCNSRLDIW